MSKGHVVIAVQAKNVSEAAAAVIEGLGYEPVLVQNGNQAIAAVDQNAAKLVLADYLLPEKSGLGMASALRSQGNKVPVLIFTSSDHMDRDTVLRSGASDFLKKPFKSEVLEQAIRRFGL